VEVYYGKGGRITKSANEKLVKTAYQHDIDDFDILINGLHIADIAHAIILLESDSIPASEGKELLKGLICLTHQKIIANPELGDVYNSKENALSRLIGSKSGWLHLGRARREAINSSFLLRLKSETLNLFYSCISVINSFKGLIENGVDIYMTDYTYMLHAQPTTLGHYLGTYLSPLLRDCDRLVEFYDRLDSSWAGIGSINGTTLNLSRERLAELLGFEKVSHHTRDAMWQPDIPNEGMYIVNSVLGNLNRFVEELIVWNTNEFKYIEIDDSYARASVIMPQKKNPYPLAYLRGLTSQIQGSLMSYLSLGKVSSGFPDSRIFIYGDIIRNFRKVSEGIDMFGDFLYRIKWNKKRMIEVLEKSDVYAMDLSQNLSINLKIDYKLSHKILGKSIRRVKENDTTLVEEISISLEEFNVHFDSSTIKKLVEEAIDYKSLVNKRKGIGAASADSIGNYLLEVEEKVNVYSEFYLCKKEFISKVEKRLNKIAKSILKDEFQEFKIT